MFWMFFIVSGVR